MSFRAAAFFCLGLAGLFTIPPVAAEEPYFAPYRLTTSDLRALNIEIGDTTGEQLGEAQADADPATSEKCLALMQDINADMGELLGAGCKPSNAQMAKLMDNPLGSLAAFVNQFDVTQLKNPNTGKTETKGLYTGILQFPKGISENWNVINRIIFTVPSVPIEQNGIDKGLTIGESQGAILPPKGGIGDQLTEQLQGRTTGLGDSYYLGLLSPKKGIKHGNGGTSVWGVGGDLMVPTGSKDVLGTGKWAAGPSAIYAYLGPKWKLGVLGQHYWSFAGDGDRADVNLSNIQTFYYYALTPTTSIGAAPNIIGNWEQDKDNRWTLPIGTGINTTVNIGGLPVRIGAEVHYSVLHPDDVVGSRWNFRLFFIPAVPSALFGWMK